MSGQMNSSMEVDTKVYKVVVNREGRYSIWPADGATPPGWRNASATGLKRGCLAYIKQVWTDMRPLSPKKVIEETSLGLGDNEIDCPKDGCIHHLFEAQAEHTPDNVAIVFEDQKLTYRELNSGANQLAHYLQRRNVGPDIKVGLSVDRSPEMAVGMLGIFKAGGAYVPLDPTYPTDRLSLLIKETQVPVLLTQERLLKRLPECGTRAICLDRDRPVISQQSGENPNSRASEAALSHVIFTSGSTGIPKGVMVTHASLCHNINAVRASLAVTSYDVYLHTASIAFTSSLRQLLVPLSVGAATVITTPEQRTNPMALFDLIKRKGVTIMDTVPSFWRSCTDALDRMEPSVRNNLLKNRLRLLMSSSEDLRFDIPRKWISEFENSARFVNMYGQTETIGNVVLYPIPGRDNEGANVVPLGRPIACTHIYLLDQQLQAVSAGVTAELHVGGLSLARGYLDRPDLTAEKFVPDPFSAKPGARLYKTGDMGRFLPNGTIEFLGRIDHQIKIRGFRIEPVEIETALKQHAAIRETVVVARDDSPGEKRLVAYFVPDAGDPLTIGELRGLLNEKLPEYMVPSIFVELAALPRLPNGKIDRRRLPAPQIKRPDLGHAPVPPRSELQRYLSDLWCHILRLDQVGIHDRFFELGGTSLQAARLVNTLQKELGESIYVTSIFEAPTINEYSAFLKKHYAKAIATKFQYEVDPDAGPRAGKTEIVRSLRGPAERQRQLRLAYRAKVTGSQAE